MASLADDLTRAPNLVNETSPQSLALCKDAQSYFKCLMRSLEQTNCVTEDMESKGIQVPAAKRLKRAIAEKKAKCAGLDAVEREAKLAVEAMQRNIEQKKVFLLMSCF